MTHACVACGSATMTEVLDLGLQKPVNNLGPADAEMPRYPLTLDACPACGHGQLGTFVPPRQLFDDYLYASSTSQSLKDNQDWFARRMLAVTGGGARVLEIASNDGLLMDAMREAGLSVVGVEPAVRMAERALAKGHTVAVDYWPAQLDGPAAGPFAAVTGQNVMAHTPDPLAFLTACGDVLDEHGVAVFQTSQTDMVANGEFDTIYHEHVSFFCTDSARALGRRAGFPAVGVRFSTIHGTSSIYFFARTEADLQRALEAWDQAPAENDWTAGDGPDLSLRHTRSIEDWQQFAALARQRMAEVRTAVDDARAQGQRIVAVGAAAKAITFLRAAGISPDLLVDEAVDKIGKFVDGLDQEIQALAGQEWREDDYFVISAWNFATELKRKLVAAGASAGSTALLYFPDFLVKELA